VTIYEQRVGTVQEMCEPHVAREQTGSREGAPVVLGLAWPEGV
jgi:hypothetical protein